MSNTSIQRPALIALAATTALIAVSASALPTGHPQGSMAAGGGTSSSQNFELMGAVPVGATGGSRSSRYYLTGGLAVADDAYVIFDNGLEP